MGNDLEPMDLHANPLERYQLVFLKQKNPTLLFVFESNTLMFLNLISELFNQGFFCNLFLLFTLF